MKQLGDNMNCKECEHYEFYDRPDEIWIMKCNGPTNHNSRYDNTEIKKCPDFTPKKPVEKSCQTCGAYSTNNGTSKTCDDFLGVPGGNCKGYSNWQPIKPDKPERSCRDCENSKYKEGALFCGSYNTYPSNISVTAKECSCFTPKKPVERSCKTCRLSSQNEGECPSSPPCTAPEYALWQPIKPDKPKAEVPEKELGGFIGCYDIKEGRRSDVEEERRIDKIIIDAINPPNSKEKTMSRAKKLIRKYVMGCTLYCTGWFCVVLNPHVYKLWHWLIPALDEIKGNLDKPFVEYAGHWVLTIFSIAAIALAIYAYNKAIDYVFSKLEK